MRKPLIVVALTLSVAPLAAMAAGPACGHGQAFGPNHGHYHTGAQAGRKGLELSSRETLAMTHHDHGKGMRHAERKHLAKPGASDRQAVAE